MPHIVYEVVEHDGGWAYKVGDVFSETFRTRDEAAKAAEIAAREQEVPGETRPIEYQDSEGRWRTEIAPGQSRPDTEVKAEQGPRPKKPN